MSDNSPEILVRRHPLFAIGFWVLGGLGIGGGLYTEIYGFVGLGAICVGLGALAYMNPALVVKPRSIELRNLFGFTGRTIPHDGLERLAVKEGKLQIEHRQMRALLPRPTHKSLHPADWRFLAESLQDARRIKS